MKYEIKTHRIEILTMIRYEEKCQSQVKVTNLFYKRYHQFRELGHVRPVKRTLHFVDDDVKMFLSIKEIQCQVHLILHVKISWGPLLKDNNSLLSLFPH